MANFRSIKTIFWSDSKIVDEFSRDDKYFYLYLLTNEKSNQLGCYELSIKQICRDTDFEKNEVEKLLNRFENELKIIYYDHDTKEIFIKNWHKYNWLNSEKTKKCIEKEFTLVKSEKLRDLIYPLYGAYIPHGSNKEKEKEKNKNKKNENEKEKKEIISNFSSNQFSSSDCVAHPPTLDEIFTFSAEMELGGNLEYCETFFDHYEGVGWINASGQQIKNWKSVFKNWCKKDGLLKPKEKKLFMYENENGEVVEEYR